MDILTKTENKVAENVARGFSEKEIANILFVSPSTIHNHTYNIRRKINARSAVDIARKYILSLENPKAFLITILFLSIQGYMLLATPDYDVKRPNKVKVKARTSRTSLKY